MVLLDVSGNRKAPNKCHSHTLAYLSISCSRASRWSGGPKFSVIQTELTPDVFLKFLIDNEKDGLSKRIDTVDLLTLLS
jgi:hypothetical protein